MKVNLEDTQEVMDAIVTAYDTMAVELHLALEKIKSLELQVVYLKNDPTVYFEVA